VTASPVHRTSDDEDQTRLLALSDGLFAIVLTLLVLDLHPSDPSELLSYPQLVALWPRLFGFFLTFFVGGSFWVAHHKDFERIRGYDETLLWLNLMFLLSVSLLPFTTGLIGNHSNTLAWILYAVNMIGIGLSLAAIWGYANSAGMILGPVSSEYRRITTSRHFLIPAVFLISIPFALFTSVGPYVPLLIPVASRAFSRIVGDVPTASRGARRWRWVLLGYVPVLAFVAWSIWLLLNDEL